MFLLALLIHFSIGSTTVSWVTLAAGLGFLAFGGVISKLSGAAGSFFDHNTKWTDQLPIAMMALDSSQKIIDCNDTAIFWASRARDTLVNKPISEFSRQIANLIQPVRKGGSMDFELLCDQLDPPRYCRVHLSPEAESGIRILMVQDITQLHQKSGLIRRDLGLLENVLASFMHGILITDLEGRVLYHTPDLATFLNLPEDMLEINTLQWRARLAQSMKDPGRFLRFVDQTLVQTSIEGMEVFENNLGRLVECRTQIIHLEIDDYPYRAWSFHDSTEQQRRELELQHLSTHDSLTGLVNRGYFDTELRRLRLSRSYPISLIMVDIDGLKSINDRYGHPAGDEILRQAAQVLRHACRGEDVVARLGGDEFGLLLSHADNQAADRVLERISSLQNLYNARHPLVMLSMTTGLASASNPVELDNLFQRADAEMYVSRQKKRSTGPLRNAGALRSTGKTGPLGGTGPLNPPKA